MAEEGVIYLVGRWVMPTIHHQMSVAFFKGQTRGYYLKWLLVYLYISKWKKLYDAFMDLEKAYDKS